ncbi:putative nucleotidyltransferase [Mesonia algae]|uniref:Putative nucleotidyltransferase n=1 Tax=Mesonia algae TaxID=213248 RepID=A0A2W7IAR5_9FLAO|nr:hypothetical protein [Mesonia algae]PZW43784.1 putative nucleotidyltransferase [Mesonia algae]
MNKFDKQEIISFFGILNKNNINYILLRNIGNELPDNLSKTKDIDIIVKIQDKQKLENVLLENKWEKIKHPHRRVPYLYSMNAFDFYNLKGLHIDVAYELACRSIITRQWIPLDQKIQDNVWRYKREVHNSPWKYLLSYEIEMVHLLTRCIFDKKIFTKGYISRIDEIYPLSNKDVLAEYLDLVFFKFRYTLLKKVKHKEYNTIINEYLTFKDY